MRILIFLLFAGIFASCDTTVQPTTEDLQMKIDSMRGKKMEKFVTKYASAGEGFYPKEVEFELSKEKLTVKSGQSTIVYDLYDEGIKGATSYDMWYSDNYVKIVNISIMRDVDKRIIRIGLNNHVFTNSPYVKEEPKVETYAKPRIYIVKAGDNAIKLSKQLNIPINRFPNPLPKGTKIAF